MIVKFTTKSYPDIIMFGDVAEKLLKMMGHSGTIPSAIRHEDLAAYLARLQASLDKLTPSEQVDTDEEDADHEPAVSLNQRAYPLIELIRSAMKNKDAVSWQKG